jgi:hypothetical protein
MTRLAMFLMLAACGASPEYVDEVPEPDPEPAPVRAESEAPEVPPPPCGMSSKAVRAYARRSHNGAVEGFESRGCPSIGED